jgi:hypothetical protein
MPCSQLAGYFCSSNSAHKPVIGFGSVKMGLKAEQQLN